MKTGKEVARVAVRVNPEKSEQIVAQAYDVEDRPVGRAVVVHGVHDLVVLGDRYDVPLDHFDFEDEAAERLEQAE
ncbi:hypothetical protein [Streptacidiphilus monticola]|jgi:hypothetical protein|uniref:Uncharacterized protein n=1 Tax=Streptacidiphilus monticola TaxID=2161674 RepID=A0ABW1FVP2_9ACTN